MCCDCSANIRTEVGEWPTAVNAISFIPLWELSVGPSFICTGLLSSPQHGIIRPQCALGRWAWSTVQLQGSMGIQRVADLFLALWQYRRKRRRGFVCEYYDHKLELIKYMMSVLCDYITLCFHVRWLFVEVIILLGIKQSIDSRSSKAAATLGTEEWEERKSTCTGRVSS